MKARQFLQPGEHILVVFTKGSRLEINDDFTGSTGDWVVNPERRVDRVVLYHRKDASKKNEVYTAKVVKIERQKYYRSRIYLENIQYIGETEENWRDFAETEQNPIRYLS